MGEEVSGMDQPSEVHTEQGILKTVEAAGDVTVERALVGVVNGRDVSITQAGAGPVAAQGDVRIQQGGCGPVLVGGDLRIHQGGCGPAMVRGNLSIQQGGTQSVLAAGNATVGQGAFVGIGAYARSGTPLSVLGYYNSFYPDNLYLVRRGTAGRTPWDYEVNLNLAYNWNVGRGITVTPVASVFNLLDRQTPIAYDQNFNPNASFVTDSSSPFFGQAGVAPGGALPGGGTCPSTATAPCSDNPYYRKITARTDPRFFRFGLKISF